MYRKRILSSAAALLSIGLFSLGLGTAAEAAPHTVLSGASSSEPAPLLRSTNPGASRYRAVGRLTSDYGQCTASVISQEGTVLPSAKALILTAGHCASFDGTNGVVVDKQTQSDWRFTPAYFIDTQDKHRPFKVAKVRYATMKSVDLAVVELDATYADLVKIGVYPLRLTAQQPGRGEPIDLVHAPVVGIPDEEQFLRHSQCRTGSASGLAESGWLWAKAASNDCIGVAGGTSGSPVFRAGDNRITGVLTTTVETGYLGECELGLPCETSPGGVSTRNGASYTIPVELITGCLRGGSGFDLAKPGCQLDSGRGVVADQAADQIKSTVVRPDGTTAPARWNITFSGTQTHARVKTGPLGRTDCADPNGYGPVFALAERPVFNDLAPRQEGFYLFCAIGGPTATQDSSWQQPRHATLRSLKIDDTAPTVKPTVRYEESDDSYQVKVGLVLWEIRDSRIKFGPRDQTNCADPAGYQRNASRWTNLAKDQAPWRFCAVGEDGAGNDSAPQQLDLP